MAGEFFNHISWNDPVAFGRTYCMTTAPQPLAEADNGADYVIAKQRAKPAPQLIGDEESPVRFTYCGE
jgi:hypothetical protein